VRFDPCAVNWVYKVISKKKKHHLIFIKFGAMNFTMDKTK
jgi:hypothetical protein